MKLKRAKIIVESIERTNERWGSALKGKLKSKVGEETISVSSWDLLGKILSPPRLQILSLIPVLKPKSISALAKAMKKDFKNVYSDVRFLADMGLIDLREEGRRKTLVPTAKYNSVEFGLAA